MKNLILILAALLFCCLPALATTYYVATTGSDSNFPCTSNSSPCQHIGRLISYGFVSPGSWPPVNAGDTVRIHTGTYRETLYLSSNSGTSGNPITVQAYGDGAVIIDASTAVTGWTVYSGNVYKATPGFIVASMVIDNTPLTQAAQFGDPSGIVSETVGAGQWFYDTNTSLLYAYTADGTSPAGHDIIVLPDRNNSSLASAIYGCSASYWTFNGLTIRGAANDGVSFDDSCSGTATHDILTNSTVEFNVWSGVLGSQYFTATNNNVAWNMMANWPRGRCFVFGGGSGYGSCYIWGGWGGGLWAQDGYSTFTGNTVYQNGGEGLGSYGGSGHNVMQQNTVYDNWSVNIYTDAQPFDTVTQNLVYCDDTQTSWTLNSGSVGQIGSTERVRPIGIANSEENYSQSSNLMHDATVTDNIILGCRYGLAYTPQDSYAAFVNMTWAHNTIVLPTTNGADAIGIGYNYTGIRLQQAASASGSVVKDNIVYGQGTTNWVFNDVYSGGTNLTGITLDHNLYYHPTNASPFSWQDPSSGSSIYTYAAWEAIIAAQGSGTGDVNSNPSLTNATSFVAADKALSSTSSPAYHTGTAISGVTTDYVGKAFASPPSMGALEYGSSTPTGGFSTMTGFSRTGW